MLQLIFNIVVTICLSVMVFNRCKTCDREKIAPASEHQ